MAIRKLKAQETFYLGALMLFAINSIFWNLFDFSNRHLSGKKIWWDAQVYFEALDMANKGNNVYLDSMGLSFIYHPYVLSSWLFLENFIPFKSLYTLSYLFILLVFLFNLIRFLDHGRTNTSVLTAGIGRRYFAVISIFGLLFSEVVVTGLVAGNISVIMHTSLIVLVLNFRRFNLVLFVSTLAIIIILFSLVKPFFLLYLLLLFHIIPKKKAVVITLTAGIMFVFLFFSALVFSPQGFALYIDNLERQTLGSNDLGLYRLDTLSELPGSIVVPLVYVGILSYLAIIYFKLARTQRNYHVKVDLQLLIVISLIILANPRLKEYDLSIVCILITLTLAFLDQRSSKFLLLAMIVASIPRFWWLAFKTFEGLSFFYGSFQLFTGIGLAFLLARTGRILFKA